MKNKFLLVTFVLLGLFVFASCEFPGQSSGGKDEPDPIEPTETTKFTISYYDGKKLLETQEYERGEEIVFLVPEEKEGKYFAGWYENDVLFELEIMPGFDLELKAKYEAGFTYTFVDYDGTVLKVGHGVEGSAIEAPANPTRAKVGTTAYTFKGWDKEIGTLTENITFTATYKESQVATLTYEIDGGNFKYSSYDEVVSDLLYDYNKFNGSSYTVGTLPDGAWECANFANFYYASTNSTKWAWLATYLNKVGGSANKEALGALTKYSKYADFNAANENYRYSVSYEFRAFIKGQKIATNGSFPTADYSTYEKQNGFWNTYNATVVLEKEVDLSSPRVVLVDAHKQNYKFGGWYDNPDFEGSALNSITLTKDATVYAKWIELTQVEEINVTNIITEQENFTTYKLTWQVLPTDAGNKAVKIKSSDESVISASSNGTIVAHKEGKATITITSVLTPAIQTVLPITVYSPNHFEVSYGTESYMAIGETLTLNAEYIKRDHTKGEVEWTSVTPEIATVNDGVVTGVASGLATIRATATGTEDSFDFYVTVLPEGISSELLTIVQNNNSNILLVYNQGIGAGTPVYYTDIVGSVNNIAFQPLVVDKRYYDKLGSGVKNYGPMTSVEFICVHYTGNMNSTADADNNADYFNNLGYAASIHYVTGRTNVDGISYSDEDYRAFAVLKEEYGGWHASTGQMPAAWLPTGVMYVEGDPDIPTFGVSENSKFTLNGKETTVSVPARTDGIKITGDTFICNGVTCKSINSMGLRAKVVNGEYYMCDTYWGTQQTGNTISSKGGNLNSIGIESCVDEGSDLMRTWQVTAQLVADLMDRYDLDYTRVVGHHFFSGKDCPQPMLADNLRLWDEFIKMVKAEYFVLTELSNYDLSFEVLQGNVKATGRLNQPKFATSIKYQVTLTNKTTGDAQTIVLASVVNGIYSK